MLTLATGGRAVGHPCRGSRGRYRGDYPGPLVSAARPSRAHRINESRPSHASVHRPKRCSGTHVGMRVRCKDARSKASRSSMLETYRGGSENIRIAINVAFIPVRDDRPSAQGTWHIDRSHREADQTILFMAPYDLIHSFRGPGMVTTGQLPAAVADMAHARTIVLVQHAGAGPPLHVLRR